MPDKYRYPLKPLDHMMAAQFPEANIPGAYSPVTKNVKVWQHSIKKRWGYTLDRTLADDIYGIYCFQVANGQRYTLYLTDKDLAVRMTGTSETFKYLTDTYTTGTASLSGTTLTGAGGAAWTTAGIAAGDKFIFSADDATNVEDDTNWATIATVPGETSATISAYTGATTTGAYKIRRIYSVPSNERWSTAMVDDKFIFTNGDVNVQYYNTDLTYATNVNSTYAVKAKYCAAFADRLILADVYSGGARNPVKVQYSSNTNVLEFDSGTDATAGSFEILETDDYITGLGRVGSALAVFKRDSIYFYERSGVSTSPIERFSVKPGIGCHAPYSLVEVMGTMAWLGKDDFYILNGDSPTPIAEGMRHKFYDIVSETEAQNTWGFVNPIDNEVIWVANTTEGKLGFVWDTKYHEWYLYKWAADITGGGSGAI